MKRCLLCLVVAPIAMFSGVYLMRTAEIYGLAPKGEEGAFGIVTALGVCIFLILGVPVFGLYLGTRTFAPNDRRLTISELLLFAVSTIMVSTAAMFAYADALEIAFIAFREAQLLALFTIAWALAAIISTISRVRHH